MTIKSRTAFNIQRHVGWRDPQDIASQYGYISSIYTAQVWGVPTRAQDLIL